MKFELDIPCEICKYRQKCVAVNIYDPKNLDRHFPAIRLNQITTTTREDRCINYTREETPL